MLEQFPRPPDDNGRGVHWSHDSQRWGKPDWGFWREQISALKLKWVKMIDTGDGSSIGLAKRLVDMGVMPVVRFYRHEPNPGRISSREIEAAREYLDWGVVYFETNNEPDLALEWKGGQRPENWLEVVVDNFIAEADMVRELGGYLLFPAFGPGGRGNPFTMIVERGRRDILDGNCALAIHNYCLGRPLSYPYDAINLSGEPLTEAAWLEQGGMWAWEMDYQTVNAHRQRLANPNASIMTDSTCFRAFEYFDALVNEAVGHSIPIFTTEGGYNVGQRAGTTAGDDPRYPKPTPEWAGRLTEAMFDYLQTEGPDYYFACMPWLIAVERMGSNAPPFENQGPWYSHQFDSQFGLQGVLPIVPKLKALPSRTRVQGQPPPQWARYQDAVDMTGREFDARLKYLEPTPQLVTGTRVPTPPYWRLQRAQWADATEGGIGYIFVKGIDEQGQPLEGATFQIARPNATDFVVTKGAVDDYFGNYQMSAGLGTYGVSMAEGGFFSEEFINLGRGGEENPTPFDNTSFFLTFQRIKSAPLKPQLFQLPANFGGHGLAFDVQGGQMAVSGFQQIQLWDIKQGQVLHTMKGHGSWVWAVAFHPRETTLASAGWDKTVRLWETTTGHEIASLTGHEAWVSGVAYSSDGTTLASCGADRAIRLWDVARRQQIRVLTGHRFHVWAVAFHQDGRTVASASGDKTARLWDIYSGQETAVLGGHTHGVLTVAFNSAGNLLASGSADGTIRLWEVASQRLISSWSADVDAIYSVAFTLDDSHLLAGGLDGLIRMWAVNSGELVHQWAGHTDAVRRVAIHPDGKQAASIGADDTVRLWEL